MVYLAVDFGFSSGKIIKGIASSDGSLRMETVHSFPNRLITRDDGTLVWDIEALYQGIIEGLRKAGKADYLSIDTWGVDFVLLDENGGMIGDAVCYRDSRTDRLESVPDQESLYKRTGIQKQKFNTIYQLLSLQKEHPEYLEKAAYLLFIPDYLAYRLTGTIKHEYTFASTTNLLDPYKRTWDYELIQSLGLPVHLFTELSDPGTEAGHLRPEIAERIGYDPMVILAPSHDSASAVVGVPLEEDSVFISSGTWSILGSVEQGPVISEEAMKANLSNEGGVGRTIRLVKNIMGTWMLQELTRETGATFDELEREARESRPLGIIDVTDARFTKPESMAAEIEAAAGKKAESRGELAATVYVSLATAYRKAIEELESVTGRRFSHIAITGGGSKDNYLNLLTAMITRRRVTAGPSQGTAVGNLINQMIATGALSPSEKNDAIRRSVSLTGYRRIED